MQPKIISYESHITIEPVFGERFDQFYNICSVYKFKPAELLLQKQRDITPERSNKDSFCTGHSKDFDDLKLKTECLVYDLKHAEFEVWRYKIEGIVLDHHFPRFVNIKG